MQQNQPHKLSGCFSTVLLFLLVIKSVDSLKEKQKKPIRLTPFLKKEKPITGTLEYDKRRRGSRCNFIKKRNTNMYQGKACHPCLHKSFLSFNNHLPKLHLPPKNFNEKCSNRVVRKVSQGSNFEKRYIVNSS